MIEFALFALLAAATGWLVRRKHRQRLAAGSPQGIPGMARCPAGSGRWRPGRLYADQGAPRWQPGRGPAVPLEGARATGVRVPTVREGISINPGSRIVTCALPRDGGAVEIAVMPLDLRPLLEAVPQTEAGDGGVG
ncbi:hypothetical protein OOK31_24520 [Streptomyces sp. NBC_00249]|uniref:hypothetical protein n=1 Tax=Streptomyces sp. NBC_00249 TaxID=2975690 RepID=UPI0022534FEF|nr:hypothetical protein [Streptomyces sp. NBC_00249]MCX5197022.1 hypothetical protein [Streptomyces sp. NBC_00249]